MGRGARPHTPLLRGGALWLIAWAALAAAGAEDGEDGQCVAGAGAKCTGEGESPVTEDGIAQDVKRLCPITGTPVQKVLQWLYSFVPGLTPALSLVSLWPANVTPTSWADEYIVVNYVVVARIMLGLYKVRDKSYVNMPTEMITDPNDIVHVENIHAPHFDIDGSPNFYWFESILPGLVKRWFYVPMMTCFYSSMRRLATDNHEFNGTFDDVLDNATINTWEAVLQDSIYKTKRDWVMSFYGENVTAWDGTPLWPKQMNDLSVYFKQDQWDDQLEHAMAFHLIGTHRVDHGSWEFPDVPSLGATTLPFRIALNAFAALDVRKHFGRYGVDLYFNADGLPVLLQTPTGEYVARGDKTWQYWKFVWRSTLVTSITLVDHLHFTHLRAGNLLARSSRAALPATHPMRRLLSIFTFGTIFVNIQAMHQLVGPRHALNRATPFKDFEKLARAVPDGQAGLVLDLPDAPGVKTLMEPDGVEKLPALLQAAPFYADGVLLMTALRRLVSTLAPVINSVACEGDTEALHPTFSAFTREILNETMTARYQLHAMLSNPDALTCSQYKTVVARRMLAYIFVVTGFHRHVGFVADYYKDPSLATMSWKEGEPYGRPKQHMIMTVVNVFTSTKQPLLKEDYTHLFKGMVPDFEDMFVAAWREFQKDLQEIEVEIDRRNKKRDVPNINMSPRVLESAVSK